MLRRIFGVLLLVSLVLTGVAAQGRSGDLNVSGGPLDPRQASFDVKFYRLALTVDPGKRSIEGSVLMRAAIVTATRQIVMDLDGALKVSKVVQAGKKLRFQRRGGRLLISLPRQYGVGSALELEVHYGGKPRVAKRPPWDGGFTWSKTPQGDPWVATTCQGEGADLWWPCKDHPSDKPERMDLAITVPKGLTCASNGVLASQEDSQDGQWTTFNWRIVNPISNYNITLNIAPYERLETTFDSVGGETVPVHFYVLPRNVEKGRQMLPQILEHLAFFEDVCGPYPFRNEKYGVVETPHLGMEHQTIIAYGNGFRGLARGYDWLHHHELSHEWWGNLVTNRDWKDMWIHEGFGTYMQALYLERRDGRKGYLSAMAGKRHMLNRNPLAPRESTNSHDIYKKNGGSDIYNKGSWVLHTLRWTLNDDPLFLKCIRRMCYPDPAMEKVTDGSQCRFVDTQDFIDLVNKETGSDYTWFFDVYARQPRLPRLLQNRKGSTLQLQWKSESDSVCEVPIGISVGSETRRVAMVGGKATVKLPKDAKVTIDPDRWLLMEEERDVRRRGRRR